MDEIQYSDDDNDNGNQDSYRYEELPPSNQNKTDMYFFKYFFSNIFFQIFFFLFLYMRLTMCLCKVRESYLSKLRFRLSKLISPTFKDFNKMNNFRISESHKKLEYLKKFHVKHTVTTLCN